VLLKCTSIAAVWLSKVLMTGCVLL